MASTASLTSGGIEAATWSSRRRSTPIREYLVSQLTDVLRINIEWVLRPLRQRIEFAVDPGDRGRRCDDAHPGQRRPVPDNQFIGMNPDLDAPRDVPERLGSADNRRLALGLFVALRLDPRRLDEELAPGGEDVLLQAHNPFARRTRIAAVHGQILDSRAILHLGLAQGHDG